MTDSEVPPVKPQSALDGIKMVGIDTDPETNLAQSLAGLKDDVICILPYTTKYGRKGYLVVYYDY